MRALVLALICAAPVHAQDIARESVAPEDTVAVGNADNVTARRFMVVAAHPMAAEAGRRVLALGGSAADAAVAVQAMLTLVEPQSSGLGGGAFALWWEAATGTLTSYDGRETAPMAAGPDLFLDDSGTPLPFSEALIGGRPVGTPGTPRLLETLHASHGRLPWAPLFAPAIAAAERGFTVTPRLAGAIAAARGLDRSEAARALFFDDAGAPLAAGATLRNPALGATLRLLAAEGADAFYAGPLAEQIVSATRTAGNPGLLALDDLAAYRVVERPPVCFSYRHHEICGMGPPSSGALTVGQILGMLEPWDLAGLGPGHAADHLFVEASRLAFADRARYMADADVVAMPRGLLDRGYLTARSRLIDPEHAAPSVEAGEPPWDQAQRTAPQSGPEKAATTHFVIRDAEGNLLSMTSTIEAGFGSRVVVGGFVLNNELTDFSFLPEIDGAPVANRVGPGKRPRSSMAPTIVFRDGAPVFALGSPGGARIIPYVARSLIALIDWGLSPAEAVSLPHVATIGGAVEIEAGHPYPGTAVALAARGHHVVSRDLNSGLHVLRLSPEGLTGAADPRREGAALGD